MEKPKHQEIGLSPKSTLQNRALRWMKRPGGEINRLFLKRMKGLSSMPFHFGRSNFLNVFLGYQPDSHSSFNSHPEFHSLFKSFTKHNKKNNAGDVARLWSLILNIKQVLEEDVEGNFVELGVWRGNTASVLAHYARQSNRTVYLFDTFEGFDKKDLKGIDSDKQVAFEDTSLRTVTDVIGLNSIVCNFVKGYFPDSLEEKHSREKYAIVSLDCDLYEPMKAGLDFFYPLMSPGGLLLLHDYSSLHWSGAKKAVDEFCRKNQEHVILMPDKSGSAFIRKSRFC